MEYPTRKPIRLPEFDYDAGAYFVTICTQNRRCILSEILVGDGVLDKQTFTHARFYHQALLKQEMRNTALAAIVPRAHHPQ